MNIYVGERDADLWERVETFAYDNRLTVSAFIMTACEDYLERQDEEPG